MPRRKTSQRFNWKLLLLVIIIPIIGLVLLGEYFGWLQFILGLALFVALVFFITRVRKSRRHSVLMDKYQDEELVRDIEQGYFWQGQTADQLRDALGDPEDIDEKVLKTKVKSIWKYDHLGGNRYGLRINLDNSVVTGWDQKN